MSYPSAFFTRTLENIFLFSTCYEVVNFQSKEPFFFFFAALFLQCSDDLLDQHFCTNFFLVPRASRRTNQADLQVLWPKREEKSYFLKIFFLEGKQLPQQLGLPQKALTCGAIVLPVKNQICCSCQEKENKML